MLFFTFALLAVMVTVFASLTHAWFFVLAVMASSAGIFGSVWGLLDIGVARQVAAQRQWGRGTDTAWAAAAGGGRGGPRPGEAPVRRPATASPRPATAMAQGAVPALRQATPGAVTAPVPAARSAAARTAARGTGGSRPAVVGTRTSGAGGAARTPHHA